MKSRKFLRDRRHKRLRAKISGTADVPRVCVFKSARHIYAQVIDDASGKTMFAASSLTPEVRQSCAAASSKAQKAKAVGAHLGRISVAGGVKKIVFDRGGCPFHGRVKSLADGLKENGLEF